MTTILPERQWLLVPPAALAALALGAMIARSPGYALAAAVLAGVVALAFLAPVPHLTLVLLVTAIVPSGLQQSLSVGGPGVGLVPSDILMIAGLARATLAILYQPLDRRRLVVLGLVGAFLVVALLQVVHGVALGNAAGDAGSEFRDLFGYAALLLALPILTDERGRRSLYGGLVVAGLLVGLWGIAQWVLQIDFASAGDVGVREGVAFTSTGRGQVQGAQYSFVLGVIVASAVLFSGAVRTAWQRTLVTAVVMANALGLLLTFERALWVATVLGVLLAALRAGRVQRFRAVLWLPIIVVGALMVFSAVAPGQLNTARERILTLRDYRNDNALQFRRIENRPVMTQIAERPWTGSGLGATIWWGRPADGVPPSIHTYTHNSYLRVVWKLGIVGALLLAGLYAMALLTRLRRWTDRLDRAVVNGAQAALVAILVTAVTGPPVTMLSVTPSLGVLLALCLARPPNRRPEP